MADAQHIEAAKPKPASHGDGSSRAEQHILELETVKIRTMHDVVHRISFESGGRPESQRLVFLSNRQARLLSTDSMSKLFDSLEMPTPNLVFFLRSSGIASRSDDGQRIHNLIRLFVDEVLMPLVIDKQALVICHGLNDCILCDVVGEAFASCYASFSSEGHDMPRLLCLVKAPSLVTHQKVNGLLDHDVQKARKKYLEHPSHRAGPCRAHDMVTASPLVEQEARRMFERCRQAELFAGSYGGSKCVQLGDLVTLQTDLDLMTTAFEGSGVVWSSAMKDMLGKVCKVISKPAPTLIGVTSNQQGQGGVLYFPLACVTHVNDNDWVPRPDHSCPESSVFDSPRDFDLVAGCTDTICVDCVTGQRFDFTAHIRLEGCMMGYFAGKVPYISIQLGNPPDGLAPLADLVSRRLPILLIDTENRSQDCNALDFEIRLRKGLVTLEDAMNQFSNFAREFRRPGKICDAVAFFHRVLVKQSQHDISLHKVFSTQRGQLDQDLQCMLNILPIADAIDILTNHEESRSKHGSKMKSAKRVSVTKITQQNDNDDNDESNECTVPTLDDLIEFLCRIYDKQVQFGDTEPYTWKDVQGPIDSSMWLFFHTLLKEIPGASNMAPVLISSSIYNRLDLQAKLIEQVSSVDRLPGCNTLEEMIVIRAAWDEYDRLSDAASAAKRLSKISFAGLLILGFLTVVASLYPWPPSVNELTRPLKLSSLVVAILSLLTSFTIGALHYLDPVKRWQELRTAALCVESEIWKFRTRTGQYSVDNFHKLRPRNLLRDNLQSITDQVYASGVVSTTGTFGPMKLSEFKHGQYKGKHLKSTSNSQPNVKCAAVLPEQCSQLENQDTHHCPVPADIYISWRLDKTLKFYQGRVSPYWRRQTLLTLVKIFVSVLAAFLATMDLLTGVAILGSFGGAVVSWSEFSGITNKLRRYTSSIRKFIDVKTWWESLQTVEKASAENIQYLVDMCEEVLAVECQSWRSDGKASKVMEQALKDASKEPATSSR